MLVKRADWQTLGYMVLATALLVWQWRSDHFVPLAYLLTLALAFAISIMHHNHRHVPLWTDRRLNRLTDWWYAVFQGQPGFVFDLCHNANHHRYCNGEGDHTRTWRYRDDNTLGGLAIHPLESAVTLAPIIWRELGRLRRRAPATWRRIVTDYAVLTAVVAGALALDWRRAIIYLIIPQLFSLFWLLAANYLQHAHTDERDPMLASRNFLGWVNPLCFNIGLHTAHHRSARCHWSDLPALHATLRPRIPAHLIEPSLGGYLWRVFVLAPFVPTLRSRSPRPLELANR